MITQPLIIGHRGASALAPENTITAFTRAVRDGADGIEFDVRLAGNHVPVVIHDAKLKRTAGINRLVSDFTSEELSKIDVGSWFSSGSLSEPTGEQTEHVPTLGEVFELFARETGLLYLEMKGEPVGEVLPARIALLIREYSIGDRVVVESFDLAAVANIKRIDPTIRTAALFEPNVPEHLPFVQRRNIPALAAEVKADEVALHHKLAGENLVRELRGLNFEIVVWTVEKPDWVGRAQRQGIKALITNNPAALLKHRT